jgi:hypothetical protein
MRGGKDFAVVPESGAVVFGYQWPRHDELNADYDPERALPLRRRGGSRSLHHGARLDHLLAVPPVGFKCAFARSSLPSASSALFRGAK